MSTPAVYQLNVGSGPQTFRAVINSTTYNFQLKWNRFLGVWVMDVFDVNVNPLVTGIPVVAGIDLLGQYQYMNFGFSMFAMTIGDIDTPPTFSNLGGDGQIFVVTSGQQ